MNRGRIYHGIHFLVVVSAIVAVVGIMSGLAPVVQYDDLPFGGATLFVGVAILIPGGFGVARLLVARDWRNAGKAAGLTPEGDGRYPTFTGTVDGRVVTAAVRRERVLREGGNRTFTVVECELREPADAGVVVSHTWGGGPDFEPFPIEDPDATADRHGLVAAGDPTLAETVVTGQSGKALAAAEKLDQVYVGDAGSVVADLGPGDGFRWEDEIEAEFRRSFLHLDWADDPAKVTHVTPGIATSGTTIERQVEAITAVTNAVE